MSEQQGQRLDKWLWYARIAKTRTQAAALVTSGKVRVNRDKVARASRLVRAGDVLTLAIHGRVRVLKIMAHGNRRGPAAEAQTLYADLSPPAAPGAGKPLPLLRPAARDKGSGRPTKRDRRRMEAWALAARPDDE